MSTALAELPNAIEQALVGGDLSKLTVAERLSYYTRLCESLDLNPLTKPFEYITLNGKLTLYARKDCTEQLRSKRGVSIQIVARETTEDCYVVTAQAALPNGRRDESIGAVSIGGLKGENRANAIMKAETKAKRRVTLSICGLGMLDETEIETIPNVAYTVEPPKPLEPPAPPVSAAIPAGSEPGETRDAAGATRETRSTSSDIPEGAFLITQVRLRTHGAVKASITMVGHGGVTAYDDLAVFNLSLAKLAEQVCQDGEYVRPVVKTSQTSGKPYLSDLTRFNRAEPEPIPDDSECPF